MKHPIGIGIGDAGIADSLSAVAELAPFRTAPLRLNVDDVTSDDPSGWVAALGDARNDGSAKWFLGSAESYKATKLVAVSPRSSRVTFSFPDAFATVDEALRWIERLPFEVCSLGTVYPDEWLDLDVPRFGFGQSHFSHGWGCAFRGGGHDRLVSRRWLDFGPWRVIRRPGDLSLVQFHDLDIDAQAAAAQAARGHERMGISRIGGYLQVPFVYERDVEGLYVADRRALEVVVPAGGKVEQRRMLDACALRYQHRMLQPAENRIDHIAYVFVDEADAHAHLHELWLRELEVWLVDGNGKRRLDLTYRPTPLRPEWITNLE